MKENVLESLLLTTFPSRNSDLEHTCYYFDVQAESLEGAFDRFAQCFISPLFTQSALDREVQAVDSEHAKNLQQDMWRMYQLSKSSMAPAGHPYGGFGSGNAESLAGEQNIRELLLAFFEKNYRKSLQLYKLVVLGKEPLEELQAMVEKYFMELVEAFQDDEDSSLSKVPRHELLKELYPAIAPPSKWQVPQRLHVVPVSQVHALELQFPMREILSLYKCKPTRYLSHLLGHEGSGSLLSLLKSKQYATELYADDGSKSCVPWSIFTVRMELTEAGLENVDEIVNMVFAYVDLLKSKGPQEWIYSEVKTVGDLQFRFLSQRNPMDYTCSLAGWMQQYPPELCLCGPYTLQEWNDDLVHECLAALTPDNVLVMISSPTFGEGKNPCTEEEKWYGTRYCKVQCDEGSWNEWRSVKHDKYPELRLPEINDMIATNFDLIEAVSDKETYPKDQPLCIHQDDNVCLWYKPDNIFNMPKVNIMYSFTSGHGIFTADDVVAAHLFAEIVHEKCNEFSYLASMAGLYCDISPSVSGLELQISGYSHKVHKLVERLVETMMNLLSGESKVEGEMFERMSFKVEQGYQSFLVSQPYQHAIYGGDLALELGKTPIHDKIKVLKDTSLEDVLFFAKKFFKRCHMEGLVHGNVSAQLAYDISNMVWAKTHPSQPKSTEAVITRSALEKRVVDLSASSKYSGTTNGSFLYRFPEFNETNRNSCVEIVLQMGKLDLATNAKLAFVSHLVREPAFNQLRTEEQLGYIVHTSVKTSGDHIKGLLFLIQSDSFDPIHVEERIEVFLAGFRQRIVDLSEEAFQTNVNTVVASFLEKNKNLGEESSRYWHVILNETYQFRRMQMIADHVKELSKLQVLQFFDKYVAANGPCRRKLCIQVVSKQHEEVVAKMHEEKEDSNVEIIHIDDLAVFKRSMPLFAMPRKVETQVVDLSIKKSYVHDD
jgi:insulysin